MWGVYYEKVIVNQINSVDKIIEGYNEFLNNVRSIFIDF